MEIHDTENFNDWYDMLNPDQKILVSQAKEDMEKFEGDPEDTGYVTFIENIDEYHIDRMMETNLVFLSFVKIDDSFRWFSCFVV